MQGSPQKISRSRFEIARGGKNAYYLISQSRHAWRCTHAGDEQWVQPGESVLIDSRIPYTFSFDDSLDDLSVEMPVDWLERWIADPGRVIGRPLAATTGWGLALRGAKEALVPRELVNLALPDELIEDQLGALLALVTTGPSQAPKPDLGLLMRCQGVIRGQLSKAGLVASEVAQASGVSLRSLHRAFAASGRTFGGELMRARVDEAARLLRDRRFGHLTLAEIGRRCGFLDPSHFSRQFRRLRCTSPRQFRAGA